MNDSILSTGVTAGMGLNDIERQFFRRELSRFSEDESTSEDISRCSFRERQFEIVRKADGSFLPYECLPTGGYTVALESRQSWSVRFDKRREILARYFDDPDNFSVACQEMGIERTAVVFKDPEFPYGCIQYSSFEDALVVIYKAVDRNRVLVAWRDEDHADPDTSDVLFETRYEKLFAERDRWKNALESEPNCEALFYQTEMFASPIPSTKSRIMDYLNEPSLAKWEVVRHLPVFKNRRVWEVLYLYDDSTPTHSEGFSEENIPSADTLSAALSKAVVLHNADCHRRIELIEASIAECMIEPPRTSI